MAFQKAVKTQAELRITLDGPAGSGKTFSSLVLAKHLGGKTALIDTEHGSAAKYADLFEFDTVALEEFSLATYIKTIGEAGAAGYENLIIDSLSHAWTGTGGALDEVDRKGGGNKFTNGWREVTPQQNKLIDSILAYPGNVISTMRVKMDYVLETNDKGKQVPKKVGLAPIQRDGVEYEFDVVANLDMDGILHIVKTRCPALKGAALRHEEVQKMAETLKAWLGSGVVPAPRAAPSNGATGDFATRIIEAKTEADLDGIGKLIASAKIGADERTKLREAFVARKAEFGANGRA